MSAESNAEAGIRQPLLLPSTIERSLGCCGAFGLVTCSLITFSVVIVLLALLDVATIAFTGFLCMTLGHMVLRLMFESYSNFPLRESMQIGAAGGVLLYPFVKLINAITGGGTESSYGTSSSNSTVRPSAPIVFGGFFGAAGSILLRKYGLMVMDPIYAAAAGWVGGMVVGPGILLVLLTVAVFISALAGFDR